MPRKAATKTRSNIKRECPHSRVQGSEISGESSPKKQKDWIPSGTPETKSASLTHFLRVYKGLNDWHLPIFRAIKQHTGATKVLYPGSDKHATASLIFPDVLYVDYNAKMIPIFRDPALLQWIAEHKEYEGDARMKFEAKNFEDKLPCAEKTMDLLISSCAGFLTKACAKYVKPGGHVLVSDAHFDARQMFVTEGFDLVGVFEDGQLDTSDAGKAGHFLTTKGQPITKAQVEESAAKPKNKRSFKLVKEGMFYLFLRRE